MSLNLREEDGPASGPSTIGTLHKSVKMKLQIFFDRISPHFWKRWIVAGSLLFLYILRVTTAGGWYIVSYGLGIYILSALVALVTPLNEDDKNLSLPIYNPDEEHKPFVGQYSEFNFWLSVMKAVSISLMLTVTRMTDILVYWPILLIYFLILFGMTLKKQISDMWKRKYVPISWFGKPKPGRKKNPRPPPPASAIRTHTYRTNHDQ